MDEFEMPDDFEGSGGYVDEPGTYHCVVVDVKKRQGPKGAAIDGDTFVLQVLEGTVKSQNDRQHTETFFDPNPGHKDGGQFTRKQIARLYIALGLVDPSAKGKSVAVNVLDAVDRQFVIKLAQDKYQAERGKNSLTVDGLSIYHVDDPAAAGIPKDQESLKLIKPEHRRKAEWFEQLKSKGQRQPATAGAGTSKGSAVDLNDL